VIDQVLANYDARLDRLPEPNLIGEQVPQDGVRKHPTCNTYLVR
jgi:hypothetical protein